MDSIVATPPKKQTKKPQNKLLPLPPQKKVCKHIVDKLFTGPNKEAFSKWRKQSEALLPDVKQSVPELVFDSISSPDLGNVETNRDHFRRCYNSMTMQPPCYLSGEKHTDNKKLKQTFF